MNLVDYYLATLEHQDSYVVSLYLHTQITLKHFIRSFTRPTDEPFVYYPTFSLNSFCKKIRCMTPNVAKYFDYYGLADKHADKFERWFRIALKESSVYDIFFFI